MILLTYVRQLEVAMTNWKYIGENASHLTHKDLIRSIKTTASTDRDKRHYRLYIFDRMSVWCVRHRCASNDTTSLQPVVSVISVAWCGRLILTDTLKSLRLDSHYRVVFGSIKYFYRRNNERIHPQIGMLHWSIIQNKSLVTHSPRKSNFSNYFVSIPSQKYRYQIIAPKVSNIIPKQKYRCQYPPYFFVTVKTFINTSED